MSIFIIFVIQKVSSPCTVEAIVSLTPDLGSIISSLFKFLPIHRPWPPHSLSLPSSPQYFFWWEREVSRPWRQVSSWDIISYHGNAPQISFSGYKIKTKNKQTHTHIHTKKNQQQYFKLLLHFHNSNMYDLELHWCGTFRSYFLLK